MKRDKGVYMNVNRKAGKFQAVMQRIEKKSSAMNKGSKILVKVSFASLLVLLAISLLLILSDVTGLIQFQNQAQIIQWMILYAVRTWALLFCGALLLDYLVGSTAK